MNNKDKNTPKELVYVSPVHSDFYSADDEISLIDIWLVLVRRKWIVISIAILCLALGGGYAWMKPVVYEYRSGIELAAIHGGPMSDGLELLSSRESSIVLLQQLIIPEQRKILFGGERQGPNIEVVQQKDDFSLALKSNSQSQNAEKVKQLHQAVMDELARRHAAILQKRIEIMSKPFVSQESLLRDQIKTLEEQLRLLSTRADDGNGIRSLVDAQHMGDIREEIADTRVELVQASSAIELMREASQPTRISYLAMESEYPEDTSRSVIVGLSLILGLMAGVFLAFFSEFVATAKSATQEREKRCPDYS